MSTFRAKIHGNNQNTCYRSGPAKSINVFSRGIVLLDADVRCVMLPLKWQLPWMVVWVLVRGVLGPLIIPAASMILRTGIYSLPILSNIVRSLSLET